MAQWHLIELENALNNIGWTVVERLESNRRDSFIGGWIIKRQNERIVDFDGAFDEFGNIIKDLNIDNSYGCQIRDTNISLYFYKKGNKWDDNLKNFIDEMKILK